MRLLCLSFFLLSAFVVSAQTSGIVGTDMFFAGHWLELGQGRNGSLGAAVVPPGYHNYCPSCFLPVPPPNPLAEVYDYGHDGWTVGTPPLMGDYTAPGNPYEGWAIQSGTSRSHQNCDGTAPGFISGPVSGSNTSFTNSGGILRGIWTGTFTSTSGPLEIVQETRLDTEASWFVMTAKIYNRTAITIPDVYYLRACDADNDAAWTMWHSMNNYIDFQDDAVHRVQVRATTDPGDLYPFSLCTKDCRAVALIFGPWPMTFTQDLAVAWNKTMPSTIYTVSATPYNADIGNGLVYKIGDVCPGDSAFVSYAYTFNGMYGIDSAFPEPTILVNGGVGTVPGAPAGVHDTFNTCGTGLSNIPVEVLAGTTGAWTWSSWSWSPAIGLAATTGATNSIHTSSVPSMTTYTIVGTPYAGCGGTSATTCASRTIYLTVITCFGAVANTPCVGDTLRLNAPGDSLGATYMWLGPNSWTATRGTTQAVKIFSASLADTGTYRVIRTVGGGSDTADVYVSVYPKPDVTAANNSPLCSFPDPANQLELMSISSGATVVSYSWTGPGVFSASGPAVIRPAFTSVDTGIYRVVVISDHGCTDTAFTHVSERPLLVPPVLMGDIEYCPGSPFRPLSAVGLPGTVVYWSTSAAGVPVYSVSPMLNTSQPGTYTVYCWQVSGFCASAMDSAKITVNDAVVVNVRDTLVEGNNHIEAYSDKDLVYMWAPNDGTLSNPNINNPVATPEVTTRYRVVGMDSKGCTDTQYVTVRVRDEQVDFTPTAFTPDGDGLNDYFRPRLSGTHTLIEFRVYNRWGEQVYAATGNDRGWDGTYKGAPVDAGVYYYTFIVASRKKAENLVYKGDVTLVR